MPKRSRALKKTDEKAQKPWLKKMGSSVYQIEDTEPKKTILIVGEGQTEKIYFESFPVLTLKVKIIDLEGQSKQKLIESTTEIKLAGDYDEVWCVFDMDIKHGEQELADFDNAIAQGNALGYNIAYSNDAFELWFYHTEWKFYHIDKV